MTVGEALAVLGRLPSGAVLVVRDGDHPGDDNDVWEVVRTESGKYALIGLADRHDGDVFVALADRR